MEEDVQSPVNFDLLRLDVTQDEQDSNPDPGLDLVSQDQPNQNHEGLTKLQEQLNPRCDREVKGQTEHRPDSSDAHDGPEGGGRLTESDLSPVDLLDRSGSDPNRGQDTEQQVVLHSQRDLTTAAANQGGAGESRGSVPALLVTQAEEGPAPGAVVGTPVSPTPPEPQRAERPAPQGAPERPAPQGAPERPAPQGAPERPAPQGAPERPAPQVAPEGLFPDLSSSSDGGDMTCCDLLSLGSETTVSRKSEDDDTRSVTASSVTSLFHRVQLDPLEKAWWRSSALGNTAAQRQLLAQEPGLVVKKDFITTALHWAAKQGRQEVVDLMLRSGADVNVRSGYTALHLASLHGHQHVVHSLVNTYNAGTSLRDYHGKTARHYWSGCRDVFTSESPAGGRGRRTQRCARPSLLLTRSRSQGQIHLEFGAGPQSSIHDLLDLHV